MKQKDRSREGGGGGAWVSVIAKLPISKRLKCLLKGFQSSLSIIHMRT